MKMKNTTDLLEAILYNLAEGTGQIKDQKKFDEGIDKILEGIELQ